MPTLRDALAATLAIDAAEASFLIATSGIQITENAYVSPRDDVSHSTVEYVMPEPDEPATIHRSEQIQHAGVLHIRGEESDWKGIGLSRPTLGPLAFVTMLYGADLDQQVPDDGSNVEVEISASAAAERVPDELRSTLDDLLSGSGATGTGHFPEHSTAWVRVGAAPLHIAELSVTTQLEDGPLTFSLEIHPTAKRTVEIPSGKPCR